MAGSKKMAGVDVFDFVGSEPIINGPVPGCSFLNGARFEASVTNNSPLTFAFSNLISDDHPELSFYKGWDFTLATDIACTGSPASVDKVELVLRDTSTPRGSSFTVTMSYLPETLRVADGYFIDYANIYLETNQHPLIMSNMVFYNSVV